MKEQKEDQSNIVQFAKAEEKPVKKHSAIFGLMLGFFIFSVYIFKSEFFPTQTQKTTQEEQELSLMDIGFVPFSSDRELPSAKLKFYKKEADGSWSMEEKSLKELVGKPMIIHRWASFCGPCVKELPLYDAFAESTTGTIENIAVTVGKADPKDVEAFYKRKGIKNLSIVVDEKNIIGSLYGLQGIPTSVFVSGSGKPLGYILGIVNWEDASVASLITKVLKNK